MDDERMRKIGVASGMVHALAKLKIQIGHLTYDPIPPHHTKRRRERDMRVAPLREFYAQLEADLRKLQAHLANPST